MGKIEMDLSEYEAMKSKERELEKALNNIEDLQKKVEEVNKEKIKALENAAHQVIYKTEHYLIQEKIPFEQYSKIVINIVQSIYANSNDGFFRHHSGERSFHSFTLSEISSFVRSKLENVYSNLQNTRVEKLEKTLVETKGLDEVKRELEEEIKKTLEEKYLNEFKENKEVLDKMENISLLKKQIKQLKITNHEKSEDLTVKQKVIDKLNKRIENLQAIVDGKDTSEEKHNKAILSINRMIDIEKSRLIPSKGKIEELKILRSLID